LQEWATLFAAGFFIQTADVKYGSAYDNGAAKTSYEGEPFFPVWRQYRRAVFFHKKYRGRLELGYSRLQGASAGLSAKF
jgi:hypothetical protein